MVWSSLAASGLLARLRAVGERLCLEDFFSLPLRLEEPSSAVGEEVSERLREGLRVERVKRPDFLLLHEELSFELLGLADMA